MRTTAPFPYKKYRSSPKQTLSSSTATAEDIDLIGVVGDVLVDGCKSGDARCSKAWKDLGSLAGKDSL